MGNSPSVSGPNRGGAHVRRVITKDDHSAELRPANYTTSDSENELADEVEIELFNREELVRRTKRKSSKEVTPRSSNCYTDCPAG